MLSASFQLYIDDVSKAVTACVACLAVEGMALGGTFRHVLFLEGVPCDGRTVSLGSLDTEPLKVHFTQLLSASGQIARV